MAKGVVNNTMPVVETDGQGGHELYVRIDAAPPAGSPTSPTTAALGAPTLTADRELLAAVQELTATMKEFMYVLMAHQAP